MQEEAVEARQGSGSGNQLCFTADDERAGFRDCASRRNQRRSLTRRLFARGADANTGDPGAAELLDAVHVHLRVLGQSCRIPGSQ